MAGLLSRIFLQPAQASVPARALLGLPVLLIALKKMKKKKKPVADGVAPQPKKPDPIGALWREVWPTWLSLDKYMAVLIIGNAIRTNLQRYGWQMLTARLLLGASRLRSTQLSRTH